MPMSYLWRIPTGKIRLGSDRTVNLLRNQNHLSVRKSPLEIRQMKSWSRYYDFRLSCTIFGTNKTPPAISFSCYFTYLLQVKLNVDKGTCVEKAGASGTETVSLFQFSEDKIDFDYQCQTCDCSGDKVLNAPECSLQGSLICGVCECNKGFKGNHCIIRVFLKCLQFINLEKHITYSKYSLPK